MPNMSQMTIGNVTYDLKDTEGRAHVVEVSNTKPVHEDNKIWIKDQENEYVVPSYDEFEDLNGALLVGVAFSFQTGVNGSHFESDRENECLYVRNSSTWYLRGAVRKDVAWANIVPDNRYTTPSGVENCIKLLSNQGLVYDKEDQIYKVVDLASPSQISPNYIPIFRVGFFDEYKHYGVVGGIGQGIYLRYLEKNDVEPISTTATENAEKISVVESRINAHEYCENIIAYGWKLGSLSTNTGKENNGASYQNRLRSDYIPCGKGARLSIPNGTLSLCVYLYDKNKTWIDNAVGKSWNNGFTVPIDGYVRILLRDNGKNIMMTDYTEEELNSVKGLLNFVYEIPEWIVSHLYDETENPFPVWELGTINYSTGAEESSSTVCRTVGSFTPKTDMIIRVSNPDNQGLGLREYNIDGTFQYGMAITDAVEIGVAKGMHYRVICTVSNPEAITAVFSVPNDATCISMETEKNEWLRKHLTALSEDRSYGTPAKRCFTLDVFSDLHNASYTWNSAVEMTNRCPQIDAAVFLGDLVQTPAAVPAFYKPNLIEKPFLFCIGNHDIGGGPSEAGVSSETAFTRYIAPITETGFVSTSKNYYYFDNATYKIRTVVLFEYEAGRDTESCKNYYYRRYMSSEQLQWFADLLYDTPEDYSVVVLTHQVLWESPTIIDHLFSESNYYKTIDDTFLTGNGYIGNNMSGNAIGDIVNAFIHSTAVNKTYTNNKYMQTGLPNSVVTKDFSGRENGKFICYLSGHSHAPFVLKVHDYPDQVQILVPCGSDNTSQRKADDIPPLKTVPNHYCVSFNTENRLIKLLKIGTTTTKDMRERVCGIVPY